MTYSVSSDLCKQPTLIASTEKYKQLVRDSTTELVQPIQCILSTLDRRAMALSKCANFESALRDAHLIQQLSSTSALGYIREAMIYSDQGKQRHVIDICNQALDVVDTKDPDYVTLQRVKMDAEQQANKSVDFISQLPVDIVLTTLIPLFMKKDPPLDACRPCPYLYISNLWRDRIIQCMDGLSFTIYEEDENVTHSEVIKFAQHTRLLNITKYAQGTWLGDLLRDNTFCSLKELFIEYFWSDQIDHFVSSLKYISNTLTELNLYLEEGPDLSLATIVMTCPNLTLINMNTAYDVDLSSLPMTTWPNLSDLFAHSVQSSITHDEMISIFTRFPSLKRFYLHPCTDIQSALVITDYYPSMNSLEVKEDYQSADIMCEIQGQPAEEIGMTFLSLLGIGEDEPTIDVYPILNKHSNTLKHLELRIDVDIDDDLDDVQYPRLKKLVLDSSASWIPRNAPMLQELTISLYTINTNPTVLDTIPPNLKKLKLKLADDPFLVDKTFVESYLRRLGHQSQLKDLVVYFRCSDSISSMLDAISHLGQLDSLVIHVWRYWDSNEMEEFLGKLVIGCPLLRLLRISCHNAPSITSIRTLKRLGYLEQLAFSINMIDNDYQFWSEIETFSQLKHISIYFAKSASDSWITYLKKRRPDMKISMFQMLY